MLRGSQALGTNFFANAVFGNDQLDRLKEFYHENRIHFKKMQNLSRFCGFLHSLKDKKQICFIM